MLHRSRDTVYTAVDVGTTQTRVLVARVGPSGGLVILACGVAPSRGVHKGVVIGLDETEDAIKTAAQDAQLGLGRRLPPAWISITGSNLQSYNATATTKLDYWDRAISPTDLSTLLDSSVPPPVAQRRVVLATPRSYSLDGLRRTQKPVGLHGRELTVESHIVVSEAPPLENLAHAARQAGLEVRGFILEPLASGEAVLTSTEREMGVVLVDIGGGTSDIAVFQQGTIMYTAAVPVGGYQFTNDLCLALNITYPTAEALKIQHGHAIPEKIEDTHYIEFPGTVPGSIQKVRQREVCTFISQRAWELVRLVLYHIQKAGLNRVPAGGIVVTGGTSKLPGLVDIFRDISSAPVRAGTPKDNLSLPDDLQDPSFSTSIGMLLWGIEHQHERDLTGEAAGGSSWRRRWVKWFSRLTSSRRDSAI
jgi:cell division protein FtsA